MAPLQIGEAAADRSGSPAMDAFMQRVLADPASHAMLGTCVSTETYIAAACALARRYGIALNPADFNAHLHPDPLGISRWSTAPVRLDRWPSGNWLPARSLAEPDGLAFDWAWFGAARLAEPFYEDSARRAGFLPFNRMFRSRVGLEALIGGAAGQETVAPSGFVFHMSRCGSTLAARMLMAIAGAGVVSEPEPLDAVVRGLHAAALPDRIAALRAMVAALGRVRAHCQRHFFVKLDCWHTLDLPLFRAAFPEVPWIFLYRDPLEVMMSQSLQPGIQAVPGLLGAERFGIADGERLPQTEYCARVLARICSAVVEHWGLGGGLLVDYREITTAMPNRVARHFGVTLDTADRAAMAAATGDHAKYPGRAFAPDSATRRAAAPPAMRAAVLTHLTPVHARLARLEPAQTWS